MRYYTTAQLSDNIHETPEGFLLCVGVPIARIGEYEYMDGETPLEADEDGRVLITRDAEEVFRPETICSFEGKPITIGHPADAVSPQNWSRLAKGYIQNVHRGDTDDEEDDDDLIADLLITDHDAIQLVKNGLREVSLGYDADYTQTGPGKGFQSKLVGNHLALVKEGRAGPSYSIRDEKGKSVHTKVKEKLAGIMTEVKALMATVEALNTGKSGKTVITVDKKGKTEDRSSKDADKDDDKKKETEDDASESMPNILEAIQALSDKIDAIQKTTVARDEDPDDADKRRKKDKEESTDDADEEDDENDVMARLDRVEAAVAKILKKLDPDEESEADEDADETEDAKNEGGETGTEDEMPKSTYTGDEKLAVVAAMEILAPGKKFKGKDAKRQALVEAYKTEDGKAVIDKLTGKKGLTKDSAVNVDMLFTAASELLAEKREDEMAGTKRGKVKDEESAGKRNEPMTPEKLNAMNADYYSGKR